MADQERTPAVAGRDPARLRAELARTRARMSETIDEIEDVIVEKKEEVIALAKGIRQRLDPFYKARQKPLAAVGIVFGAGLVLGVFTKGRKRKAARALVEAIATTPPAPERSGLWESRARRLLRIARQQEEELAALHARQSEWEETVYDEADEDDDYYG